MPRIAGINIPENKEIEVALTYVYGIGSSLAKKILNKVDINPKIKASELTTEQVSVLKDYIEKNFKIEGQLKRQVMMDIKRLKDLRCWRGIRHQLGLPVRGQTTRINSRTVRGNVRKTVSSGRRKAPVPK